MYYMKVDELNRVTAITNEAHAGEQDIRLDENWRDRVTSQYTEYPAPLTDASGIHLYKVDDGLIYNCTPDEMDEERARMPPSDAERITALEAQLASYEAAYAEGVNEA